MNLAFEQIQARLSQLSPSSQALWGKMNSAQVLAHLSIGFELALNPNKPKHTLLWKIIGPLIRKKLLAPEDFPRSAPTAPWFIVADAKVFEQEFHRLNALLDQFDHKMENCPALIHPNFGKLSVQDWKLLQWKHCDHHLRQFGL